MIAAAGKLRIAGEHPVAGTVTRSLAVVTLLATTCSCGSAPGGERPLPTAPQSAAAGELQCEMQRVTGTLLATRVCTLKSQRDAMKQSTQDARDFLDRQVIGACPGSPGCGH